MAVESTYSCRRMPVTTGSGWTKTGCTRDTVKTTVANAPVASMSRCETGCFRITPPREQTEARSGWGEKPERWRLTSRRPEPRRSQGWREQTSERIIPRASEAWPDGSRRDGLLQPARYDRDATKGQVARLIVGQHDAPASFFP